MTKFTKQHFEAIADILARFECHDEEPYLRHSGDMRGAMIEEFVELFDESNARFDAQCFRAACSPHTHDTKEDNA